MVGFSRVGGAGRLWDSEMKGRTVQSLFGVRAATRLSLSVMLLSGAAMGAVPTEWKLDLVARSSLDPSIPAFRLPQGSSLSSQPVTINAEGGVGVRVFLDGSSGATDGIFYGDKDEGGLILTATAVDPVWGPGVDVWNGMVAVEDGGFDGGAYVYDTSGNLISGFPIGGTLGVSGLDGPTLSSDGAIAYRADFGFVGDRVAVDEYVEGVRTQTNIADTFSGTYSFLFSPKMNATRSVAMNTIPQSGPTRRIVRFDPGVSGYTATTIAETGSGFSSFVNSIGLAGSGAVAFNARRSSDSIWQVMRGDGTEQVVIAEGGENGIVNTNLANFPPVASSNGWVAFRVEDSTSNSTALFVGDGESLVRIVTAGDTVPSDLGPITAGFNFGGDIGTQALNSNIDINDAGQIAFGLFLQNGTIGIYVATPVTASGCNGADVAEPYGELNIDDVLFYLDAFATSDSAADLAVPQGVFNIDDVLAFVDAFATGCP